MKLVKEHINEKFTQEGDPIEHMGIGTMGQLIKIAKEYFGFSDEHLKKLTDERWLLLALQAPVSNEKRFEFVKYLIQFKKVEIPEGLISKCIQNKVHPDIIAYLITRGDEAAYSYLKSHMKQ